MTKEGSIFFASDFHLGVPNYEKSREREDRIINWLNSVEDRMTELFLVGDVFDFWFEYKHVAPRGHVRLLGKLAELSDKGIPIHFFKGNHDMWTFGYLEQEIGLKVYDGDIQIERQGKKIYIGHGDGNGPGDRAYKFMKAFFRSSFCQWLFARLHPNLGMGIANYWSKKSRLANMEKDETYYGEKEALWQFVQEEQQKSAQDYYIFGHRHLPLDLKLEDGARYVNLGDWVFYNTCLLYTSPSPRDRSLSRMPSSA